MSYDPERPDHIFTPEEVENFQKIINQMSQTPTPQPKKIVSFDAEWTPSYSWFLIPTIEINTSVKEIGINILCLGLYIKWGR